MDRLLLSSELFSRQRRALCSAHEDGLEVVMIIRYINEYHDQVRPSTRVLLVAPPGKRPAQRVQI